MPKQPSKLTKVQVHLGKDVDTGKLITQIHTLLNKSKHADRVEIYLNNELVQATEESEDTSLL